MIESNRAWFRYEWIWWKTKAQGFLLANKMPLKAHENIMVFYKKQTIFNQQRRQGFKPYHEAKALHKSQNYHDHNAYASCSDDGSRCPIDIIQFAQDGDGLHPTQKPVALCEYLIKTYSNKGDTILDNCMGSGTTGVACKLTGRNFIGIEKDDHYFKVASDRIARY